jgi:membrane protease YdiL (CAAX protease family)
VAPPVRTPGEIDLSPTDWAAAATGPIEIQRPPWTFVDVFAGLGAVLLLSVVLSGPLSAVDGPATLIVSTLPLWVGLIGTVIWACRRHGTGNLVRDLALQVRWIDLATGLGAGLALRLVIGIWAVVYSAATGQRPTSNLEPILGGGGLGTGFWLVVNLLAIGVIGPVIEEIFFRGLGLRSALASLLRRADRPRFVAPANRAKYAIAATSLIFALLHTNEINDVTSAVVLLPGLFLAGWVLGWLTVRTGRLGPGIATHIVFNSTALLALLFLQ